MQHVLVAAIIRLLIGHPTATLHPYGVTATEVVVHLCTVTTALKMMSLKVPVLVEDYLLKRKYLTVNTSVAHSQLIEFQYQL